MKGDLVEQMHAHAAAAFPQEACGLVLASGKKGRIVRAANVAADPGFTFDLDPNAWLEVTEDESVIGIYHSHPSGIAEPSLADLSGCELSSLPWHIVGYQTGDYRYIEPHGFRAPYEQRPYVFGVHDCYGIIRDWYLWEYGVKLPNFKRTDYFWERGEDLFNQHFREAGFVSLVETDPQPGDCFLLQVAGSKVPNHIVLYIGGGIILHHASGRLSRKEQWGGHWQKHAVTHLRHNTR